MARGFRDQVIPAQNRPGYRKGGSSSAGPSSLAARKKVRASFYTHIAYRLPNGKLGRRPR